MKTILSTLAVILIAAGLLVGTEFGLRLIFAPPPYQGNFAYAFDPDSLVRLKPNVEKTYELSPENGGAVIHWRSNSAGFRGPELMDAPDYRAVVYGDSNVQARFSRQENTFVARLQAALRRHTEATIEVVNAGLIGAGTDQSLLQMMKDFDRLKPQLVVFHVNADNDFGDIIRNRLFELDTRGNLVRTNFAATDDAFIVHRFDDCDRRLIDRLYLTKAALHVGRYLGLRAPEHTAHSGPALAEAILKNIQVRAAHEFQIYADGAPRCYYHFGDNFDIDIATAPKSESARIKVALMSGVLARAKAFVEGKGSRFMVVIQPAGIDLTENFPLNHTRLEKFPGYDPANLSNAVLTICQKLGIPRVNLYPVFRAHDPKTLYFRVNDNHWNDLGQAVAAEAVSKFIVEQIWSLLPRGQHSAARK